MADSIRLASGFHKGLVKSYSPSDNTIKVVIKEGDGTVIPCIWAASIISGMLGLKTSYIPPVKTEVIVWWPPRCAFGYIMGTFPGTSVDTGRQARHMTGGDEDFTAQQVFHSKNSKQSQVFVKHKPPVDLAEGELHMDNLLGVGISLLRNMASLQAGDLARVECHVLDDMVRILSDTFRHYSAFGDYSITNDGGRLNVVWNGTSNDFEAWGNKDAQTDRATMTNPSDVNQKLSNPNQTDDGRWRFTQYIGWLGGFMHTFFTDPVDALGRIAENQFRSGKAHIHVHDDGSILAQSVADIILEKVIRIPVPVPIRKESDPQGNLSDVPPPHPEFLKTWVPSDKANLFEMAFQLREYSRWLNNTYALARFHQMDRDWQVPSEAQTPAPDINAAEVDRKTQNSGASNWQLAYSTIRIYRDGSIQTVDVYGNAITTTKVGIQISSPKDILIQAGGSVNIVAGRDCNVVAQNNLNLSAVKDSLRLCAKTGILGFCQAGNILMEVATGYWHRWIGPLTANTTFGVLVDGQISTQNSVNAVKDINTQANVNAGVSVVAGTAIIAGNSPTDGAGDAGIFAQLIVANQVFQTEPYQDQDSHGDTERNHTWPGGTVADNTPNATDIEVGTDTTNFQYQVGYTEDALYQTMTQQQLAKGDCLTKPTGEWSFTSNEVDGRGAPWPGVGTQELTTSAGDPLNTPSSETKFTNTPAALKPQNIVIKTA